MQVWLLLKASEPRISFLARTRAMLFTCTVSNPKSCILMPSWWKGRHVCWWFWGRASCSVYRTWQERRRIMIIDYCLYSEMSVFCRRNWYEAIFMIMLMTVAVFGNQIWWMNSLEKRRLKVCPKIIPWPSHDPLPEPIFCVPLLTLNLYFNQIMDTYERDGRVGRVFKIAGQKLQS